MDLDNSQLRVGIEGEEMSAVYWACEKRPVFLAVSFRRVGWTVTLLNAGDGRVCEVCTKATTAQYLIYLCLSHSDAGVRDKTSGREKPALDFVQLAQKSLTDLDSSITLFQAMLQIVKTADAARAQPATAATAATGPATQPAPASAHHASGVESEASSQQRAAQGEEGRGGVASGGVAGVAGDGAAVAASKMASASAPKLVMHTRAHQPFRLLYDVRIHGLESSLAVLESVTDANVKIGPRMQRVRREQVWLKASAGVVRPQQLLVYEALSLR